MVRMHLLKSALRGCKLPLPSAIATPKLATLKRTTSELLRNLKWKRRHLKYFSEFAPWLMLENPQSCFGILSSSRSGWRTSNECRQDQSENECSQKWNVQNAGWVYPIILHVADYSAGMTEDEAREKYLKAKEQHTSARQQMKSLEHLHTVSYSNR